MKNQTYIDSLIKLLNSCTSQLFFLDTVKSFWEKNKIGLWQDLYTNNISLDQYNQINDGLRKVASEFFLLKDRETIPSLFQDLSQFLIALKLQKKAIGVENFLRYFNPKSSYYLRMKALTLFRLLNDPVSQIESVFTQVCDLLYEAISVEPESGNKVIDVLKEYIDRVFSLTRTTQDSRYDFMMNNYDKWNVLCLYGDFNKWLAGKILDNIDEVIDKLEEKVFYDTNEHEKDIIIDNYQIELQKIADEKKLLEKHNKNLSTENDYLSSENNKLEDENAKLKEEKLALEQHIQQLLEEKSREVDNNDKKAIELAEKQSNLKETELVDDLKYRRNMYRITVVGGSPKANKKFKLMKKNENPQLDEFYLRRNQFTLKGDFDKQHDKNFSKDIENSLLLGKTDFVIILTVDHNTSLCNLIKNTEYCNRITVLSEREGENGDKNPMYNNQKLSNDSFIHYLKIAIEKYERDKYNVN